MKKVVLLEDDLIVARNFTGQLQKWHEQGEALEVDMVLFYDDTVEKEDVEELEGVKQLREDGVEVKWVNIINFDRTMDELYQNKDILFIFDTILLTDESSVFRYRINVSYALRHKADKRIWMYTNAGQEIKDNIDGLFEAMVMDTRIEEGKYELQFRENQEFVAQIRGN